MQVEGAQRLPIWKEYNHLSGEDQAKIFFLTCFFYVCRIIFKNMIGAFSLPPAAHISSEPVLQVSDTYTLSGTRFTELARTREISI